MKNMGHRYKVGLDAFGKPSHVPKEYSREQVQICLALNSPSMPVVGGGHGDASVYGPHFGDDDVGGAVPSATRRR